MNKPKTKLIFAGTPTIASYILTKLYESNLYEISCVLTQPDKPSGRGQKLQSSPVKHYALEHNLPIIQTNNLKSKDLEKTLVNYKPDLMIVIAYGLIIPKAILDVPTHGCLNIHTSLLPKWRGAGPIMHSIIAQDKTTGVSIMLMEPTLDTGPVLSQQSVTIPPDITCDQLTIELTYLANNLLIQTIPKYLSQQITPISQSKHGICYAHKIKKTDALINWQQPLSEIEAKIRAFNPWPVAYTYLNNERIRIWQAKPLYSMEANITPGTIIEASKQGIDVSTNGGILRILQLQRPGGKTIPAYTAAHHRQNPMTIGLQFK